MKKTNDNNDSRLAGMFSINLNKSVGSDTNNVLSLLDENCVAVLPTRNLVLFPRVALPIQLGREKSISVAQRARKKGSPIVVACQKDPQTEDPGIDDLYDVATLARVIDVIELPNGIKTAIVEGLEKVFIYGSAERKTSELNVKVRVLHTRKSRITPQLDMMLRKIREISAHLSSNNGEDPQPINMPRLDNITDPEELIGTVAVHLPFDVEEKQSVLKAGSIKDSAALLLQYLMVCEEKIELMHEVMDKTRSRMEEGQRSAFLQQQIEVLRNELEGDEADELEELEARAQNAGLPEAVAVRFDKELRKLRRYNPQSPDYAVQYTYLETLLSLPWRDMSAPVESFSQAEQILENDHYGLRKVKDRILEQIALIVNNPEGHSPIICFVGPPGVGKTSLGQSIADALGREFQRVSLGGLHDEAEIRGHRRTYIGAMPGRIIEALRRSTTVNPVIMLDELDKIGNDFKGDPAAALLEVLDPAQNFRFHDNYIDVDYDLSSVLFIATANTLSTISKPLLDRIEIIELSGYTVEEKIEIAVRHLIPRLLEKNRIDEKVFYIGKSAIKQLIERYTAESGVRQLEKRLESLMRKQLLKKMRHQRGFAPEVTEKDLEPLLGSAPYRRDVYEGNDIPGVVTGLAWTSVGGEILLVEAALSPGKGNIMVTGNLGDVMKESATVALEWLKVNASEYNIESDVFKNNDFHIHFPEGAVPKDGPSAGITIVTALFSAITKRKVAHGIAMTGEVTLRGKVLPVGGIKEKILAAKRAGIKVIVMSRENEKDIKEIEKKYLTGLTFKYVDTVREVLKEAIIW